MTQRLEIMQQAPDIHIMYSFHVIAPITLMLLLIISTKRFICTPPPCHTGQDQPSRAAEDRDGKFRLPGYKKTREPWAYRHNVEKLSNGMLVAMLCIFAVAL